MVNELTYGMLGLQPNPLQGDSILASHPQGCRKMDIDQNSNFDVTVPQARGTRLAGAKMK